jgi:hypothetical protein
MDDQTSREAARRSFRVAEFFLIEEARRKQSLKQSRENRRQANNQPQESSDSTESADQPEQQAE